MPQQMQEKQGKTEEDRISELTSKLQIETAAERKGRIDAEKKIRDRDTEIMTLREDFEEFKKGSPTDDERSEFRAQQRSLRKDQQSLMESQKITEEAMLSARRAQIKAMFPKVTDEHLDPLALTDLNGFEAALKATSVVADEPKDSDTDTPKKAVPSNDRTDTTGAEGGTLSQGQLTSRQKREIGMQEKRERESDLRANLFGGRASST